jgi:hypothetical protein
VTYNASSRKDIRRAEKASELAEKNRIDFIRAAMGTLQGRVWFYDLLEFCHLFNDPFTGDPLREAYSKGERNVGLRLFSDIIAHCPSEYISMMREAQIKELTNERRDLNDDDGSAGDDELADAYSRQ